MASLQSQVGTVAVQLPTDGADSGVYQTSPGLLRRAAISPYAEGLSQYLAIRLGDGRRGRTAYQSLLRIVRSLPADELIASPGPKAQLFRLARSVAEVERAMPGLVDDESELPWRGHEGRLGKLHARLREALGPDEAELLELRHARELTVEEIACVLERTAEDVELALDTAEARARQVLGPKAPDPLEPRPELYVEAFALARSWQDESLPPAEEVEGLEPGSLIGGRYQIVERVGEGAFGDVYRAEDVEVPGHEVALKMLRQPSMSESSRQSALRELKLNAAAFHPSLVQFKDHGWFEQRLWFVMPWYEGETLEARMKRGALTRAEARRIFEPLARALAALHEAGIRHQDIKPENVLLTRLPGYGLEDGILPVLIDLGVAAEEQETLLGGTPLYFAPEVAARFVGEQPDGPEVDRAADVFALALSLRNALEPGTQEDVPAGAVHSFVERRARQAPPLPEARDLRYLRPCWDRWLSLDPSERPCAEELAEELAILTEPEERRERRVRVVRWLIPLLLTLAAAFGGVVYALEMRAEHEEAEAQRARLEASSVRADLIATEAHRRALEEGHAELSERYEQSRLTRRDLAGQLATAEGELRILHGELGTALAAGSQLRERLTDLRVERRQLTEDLARTSTERDEAQRRGEGLARELGATRDRATALTTERDDLRSRVASLGTERDDARRRLASASLELGQARVDAEAQRDRADALAAELAEARAARTRAESDRAAATGARERAERELTALRGRLEALADVLDPTPAAAPSAPPNPAPSAAPAP